MPRGHRTRLLLFFAVRRCAMVGVAIGSICTGAALLWLWFTPERIGGVETLPLLALLGLFVLPVIAAFLVRHDRRDRRDRRVRRMLADDEPSQTADTPECRARHATA